MPVMPKEIIKLIRKRCWSVLDRPLGLLLMRNLTSFTYMSALNKILHQS